MRTRMTAAVAALLLAGVSALAQDKPAEKPAETKSEPAKSPEIENENTFAALAGSWSGGGTITLSTGGRERLRCRARHTVGQDGRSLSLSIRCAADSYRIELTSNVVNRRGRIFGSWRETANGFSGQVSGTATGGRIRAVATSGNFTAGLAITTSGRTQSVSITPRDTLVASVHVSLRKN